MPSTFRLKMLPVLDGDCLVLSWGDDGAVHHMMIDGGRQRAYEYAYDELAAIAAAGQDFDLYILSHVEADRNFMMRSLRWNQGKSHRTGTRWERHDHRR